MSAVQNVTQIPVIGSGYSKSGKFLLIIDAAAPSTSNVKRIAYEDLLPLLSETVGTPVAVTNRATGGTLGTAANTVDKTTHITVNQTTAAQTMTVADPTDAAKQHRVVISNIGSVAFTVFGASLAAGASTEGIWTGAAWSRIA